MRLARLRPYVVCTALALLGTAPLHAAGAGEYDRGLHDGRSIFEDHGLYSGTTRIRAVVGAEGMTITEVAEIMATDRPKPVIPPEATGVVTELPSIRE